MAIGWTQGTPCDLFREHLGLNITSFQTTPSIDSDLWQETALYTSLTLRTTHAADSTAYGAQPTATSWTHQLRLRPATGGQLT